MANVVNTLKVMFSNTGTYQCVELVLLGKYWKAEVACPYAMVPSREDMITAMLGCGWVSSTQCIALVSGICLWTYDSAQCMFNFSVQDEPTGCDSKYGLNCFNGHDELRATIGPDQLAIESSPANSTSLLN
ncbi:hypothetical protein EV183_001510 [Coemansia sp. RSA 2336]|nr:hypothetical protein EV183_001510 [Coemansia sp. RSA 2336]